MPLSPRVNFWLFELGGSAALGVLVAAGCSNLLAIVLAHHSVAIPPVPDDVETTTSSTTYPEVPWVDPCAFGCDDPTPPTAPERCAGVACDDDAYCDVCTGACVPIPIESSTGPGELCVQSDLALELVGTVVEPGDVWTHAIFHNPSTGMTHVQYIGDTLLAQATIEDIRRNQVVIARGAGVECIGPGSLQERIDQRAAQIEAIGSAMAPPDQDPAACPQTGETPPEPTLTSPILEVERDSFIVERDVIDELIGAYPDPGSFRLSVRSDGRFMVQGVRADSVEGQLGLRNGDVVVSINGIDPFDLDGLVRLQGADSVVLVVERRGVQRTLRYEVR